LTTSNDSNALLDETTALATKYRTALEQIEKHADTAVVHGIDMKKLLVIIRGTARDALRSRLSV
jgi:hypothetical protein